MDHKDEWLTSTCSHSQDCRTSPSSGQAPHQFSASPPQARCLPLKGSVRHKLIAPAARVRRQREHQVRRVQFIACPYVVRERRLGCPGQRRGRANRGRSQRSSVELPLLRHSGGSPASSCRHGVPAATVAAGLRCRRGIPGPPKVGGLRATWLRLAKHLCSWLVCTPRFSRRAWQGSTKTKVP